MQTDAQKAMSIMAQGMTLINTAILKNTKLKKKFCGVCGNNLPTDAQHLSPCSDKCVKQKEAIIKRNLFKMTPCGMCGTTREEDGQCMNCLETMNNIAPFPPTENDYEVPHDPYDDHRDMEVIDEMNDEPSYEHFVS